MKSTSQGTSIARIKSDRRRRRPSTHQPGTNPCRYSFARDLLAELTHATREVLRRTSASPIEGWRHGDRG